MSEATNGAEKSKEFVQQVFSAEENSAAALGKDKLGKYSDIAVNMFHTPVLGPKEKILPAVAQFATKLLSGVSCYDKLYYVNVLKIDMTYVAIIETLIGIYDILNNPIMGIAYDRTRTRWGKARPYVVFAAIPYFLVTALLYCGALFLGDSSGNDPKKILFVFLMLFAKETFSTIYSIPRDNMLSLQTANPKDRIDVGLLQTYIGELASQLIYLIFLPIMELNNKGYINFSMALLFAILGIFSCSIGAAGNMAMGATCKERIILQPKPAPITKSLFYVLKNKYALRNFIASMCTNWWSSGGYSWDVVTQQEIFGGSIPSFIAYAGYNVMDTVSISFIPKFQKLFKNNNRNAVIALRLWDIVCVAGMAGTCIPLMKKENRWLLVACYGFFYTLNGMNNGPANVFEAELSREINDYTEYMTGERPDGTFSIITNLILKVTSPLNTLLTVKLFKWSGYDTTITMLPWSQNDRKVYQKVFFLFNGVQIFPRVVNCIPYLFYDLVGEKREQMYIALNERRALVADRDTELDAIAELADELENME